MKLYLRHLLYTLLIISLISACSPEPEAVLPADVSSFGFSVDPASQNVSLNEAGAAGLSPQQTSDDPRILDSTELRLESYNFAFLPGNVLRIEASFKNFTGGITTPKNFEQPFTFDSGASTQDIVSSTEPTVSDADLGSDGILSPGEVTSVLVFEVLHNNRPFIYRVEASAVVTVSEEEANCDDPSNIAPVSFGVAGAMRRALDLSFDAPLTCAAVATIEQLNFDERTRTGSLEGIQFAVNLRELKADRFSNISDLTPLSNLTKLETFKIYARSLTDISPLANLTLLQELTLSSHRLTEFSPLAGLTELRYLNLSDGPYFDSDPISLVPLSNMTKLEYLNLDNTPFVSLDPLINLTEMEFLDISSGCCATNPDISFDLTGLSNMTKLKELIVFSGFISDLTPLANLVSLETLMLYMNEVSDLTVIRNMTNLNYLELAFNKVTDITPLVNNPNLGEGDDQISLLRNCLDFSEGSTTLATIQILEDRNPDKRNVSFGEDRSEKCVP